MGLFKRKKETRQYADGVEAEIISPNAIIQRNTLTNNQFNQNSQMGNNAGTTSLIPFHTSEEQAQLGHALVWSATQQAAAGTPMEIRMLRNRVVLNQAMLCYVDNVELTQEPFYYGETKTTTAFAVEGYS